MTDLFTSPGFIFGAKSSGSVPTYGQLLMRRKIAEAMASRRSLGFPKTFGEGLTYLGDAIGEVGQRNQLDAMEQAKGARDQEILKGTGIGTDTSSAVIAPPAPTRTSYAPESDAEQPTPAPATSVSGFRPPPAYLSAALERDVADPQRRAYLGHLASKEAQSPDEVSPTGAAGPFQFTRGTGRQYGLMPDGQDMRTDVNASIAAVNNLTDDNAATLTKMLGRPPNPSELALAHQQGAVTAGRMLTGTGNAPGNNLAVNNVSPNASPRDAAAKIMAYYRMPNGQPPAQPPASGSAMPFNNEPGPATAFSGLPPEITTGASATRAAPSPPPQASALSAAPSPPSLLRAAPAPTQVAQAQLAAPPVPQPTSEMQKINRALSVIEDPIQRDALTRRYQELQAVQTNTYNQRQKEYEYQRGQAQPEKVREADIATRFGGQVPYQQFVADTSKSYDATQQLANTMPTFRQAKQALAQSYTGSGSELRLDAGKMLRQMGVPGDYTPLEATEMLQSRMKAIAGGLIKSTVGSTNISDADREFVEKAYSGNIKMEPESLRKLLSIAEDTTIRSINRHNDRLTSVASDPVKDAAVRNQYSVPMQYGDEAVAYLKAHPETADLFDKKFGKGHAKAVLAGGRYGR